MTNAANTVCVLTEIARLIPGTMPNDTEGTVTYRLENVTVVVELKPV